MKRIKEQNASKNLGEVNVLGPPPLQSTHQRPLGYSPKLEFPIFYGTYTRFWIRKANRYFHLCKINEDQKMDFVTIYMSGKAKSWFDAYTLSRCNIDWGTFCLDLSSRFREDLGSNIVEDFNKLTQIGTLEDYLDRSGELNSLMVQRSPQLPDFHFLDTFRGGVTGVEISIHN